MVREVTFRWATGVLVAGDELRVALQVLVAEPGAGQGERAGAPGEEGPDPLSPVVRTTLLTEAKQTALTEARRVPAAAVSDC